MNDFSFRFYKFLIFILHFVFTEKHSFYFIMLNRFQYAIFHLNFAFAMQLFFKIFIILTTITHEQIVVKYINIEICLSNKIKRMLFCFKYKMQNLNRNLQKRKENSINIIFNKLTYQFQTTYYQCISNILVSAYMYYSKKLISSRQVC